MAGAFAALYRVLMSLVTGSAKVRTRIRRSPGTPSAQPPINGPSQRPRSVMTWCLGSCRTKAGGVQQAGLEAHHVALDRLVERELVGVRVVRRDARQREQVHGPDEEVAMVARHAHAWRYIAHCPQQPYVS